MFQRQVCPHVVNLRPGTYKDVMQVADERQLLWPRQLLVPLQSSCRPSQCLNFCLGHGHHSALLSPYLLPSCVAKVAAVFGFSFILSSREGSCRVHKLLYVLQEPVKVLRETL